MHWSQSLVTPTLCALLITLFPQVDALRTCHFESECALRPNSKGVSQRNLQLNDVNDKAEAMEKCCTELQGATFFLDGCNPCPPKVQTLSADTLSPPVSLGSASDVIVALRCTVGGPDVAFSANVSAPRPLWLPPSVSYATIDSADRGIIRIEAARVTEDLRLECQFATNANSGRIELQEVSFNRDGSLFGTEGTNKELPNGGAVTLRCPIPDVPDRNVTWHRSSGDVLSSGKELPLVTQAGLYFCVSTDERGRFVSNYISVYNQGDVPSNALGLSASLPNEILRAPGSDVELRCTSEGSSDIEWLYNGEVIDGATGSTYMIQNLTESTSGYYQCRIGGQTPGSIVSSSYVHTASVSVTGESCALRGSQYELTCTFRYPTKEREIQWYRNDQPVLADGRRVVSVSRDGGVSVSSLAIDTVEEEDGGTYSCKVRVFGTDDVLTDAFQVTTVATPSEPQNIRFSMVTQTEATVTWDASVDGGNLPIERYYVQWFNTMEGVLREAGVEANGELVYMITGLETYMVYSVRVFANNGKYNGTVAVMNLTSGEDTPVNPPRNLLARPIHANEMELQWEEPAPPLRGQIVQYIVTYQMKGSSSNMRLPLSGARTMTVVEGLSPGTEYEFFVEAATSAGSGPRAGPVNHTTLSRVSRLGPSTPAVDKTLSTTVRVMLPRLQSDTGIMSHFQLVVVRLPCPPGSIDSGPDEMFPYGASGSFALYNNHSIGQAYIAAEIDADKLNTLLSTPFVIGDESHTVARMNDVERYRNGPLAPQACYTFFMRGFLSVPMANQAKRKRDVLGERRYRTFVSSDFMTPIQTLPERMQLQIRFFSVDSCTTWTNANTEAKIATLKEEVARIIDAACNCNFNTSDIETATFSCMNPRSSNGEAVVLRMTVREKNGFGAPAAVMAVSEWTATSPTITISLVQYTVSSSCPTELASSTDPDCGPPPVEMTGNLTVIIASSVCAGILTLVLVAAIVGMVIWMCRRSSKAKYETDERDKTKEPEVQGENGVVIPNPPEVDGSTGDPRPKVLGRSSSELPAEGVNYYAPYPVQPAHSIASLNSLGGTSPYPPPMPPIPPGFRPQVVGMPMWAPHNLLNHRRTASGGSIGIGSNPSPAHSRQPSDLTTDGRRYPEYSYYYPYQYHYMPQPMYMYGSPVGHRRVATMDAELEAYHYHQESGNSMQAPNLKRPHTTDLLEREVPRGMSPMYPHYYQYHYPQESDMSHFTNASEQPMIHPFPRREPKLVPYSAGRHPNGVVGEPSEGKASMDHFLDYQLEQHRKDSMRREHYSAEKLPNGVVGEPSEGKASMDHFLDSELEQHRRDSMRDGAGAGSNDIRSDASEVSSASGKLASSVGLANSAHSIESEVL